MVDTTNMLKSLLLVPFLVSLFIAPHRVSASNETAPILIIADGPDSDGSVYAVAEDSSFAFVTAKYGNVVINASGDVPQFVVDSLLDAVAEWDEVLQRNDVPLEIDFTYKPLVQASLAYAGPYVAPGLDGSTLPVSLINAISGYDRFPYHPDMSVTVNSSVPWNEGSGYELKSVLMHELGHGFGFVTGTSSGTQYAYDNRLYHSKSVRLVDMYPLNTSDVSFRAFNDQFLPIDGESLSHFREDAYGRGQEGSLMTPYIAGSETFEEIDSVTLQVMEGIGWNVIPHTKVASPVVTATDLHRSDLSDQITRLYGAYFRRTPDASGLRHWMNMRASGMTLEEISQEFANSKEFVASYGNLSNAGFIEAVYLNTLNRYPDADGAGFWLSKLSQGMQRGTVMTAFSESPENVRRTGTSFPMSATQASVWRLYGAVLGRPADSVGLDYWTGQIEVNGLEAVARELSASPEFTNRYGSLNNTDFVKRLYQNVMGRDADAAGLSFWVERMNAGASRAEVILGFSNSVEFVVKTGTVL